MNIYPLSVVIPTYKRPAQLVAAIRQIQACDPAPAEIIVHIDGDDDVTQSAIYDNGLEEIVVLKSNTQVGPGGGRNRAIAQAKHEIVASFDDDSYPLDTDYFARLLHLFEQFPQAAVIGAAIYHIDEPIEPDTLTAQWEHSFVGCGCAYRKSVFQATKGYVALPVAYGMEEVDLSLRLHDAGWGILISPWLRVFHNTRLEHHSSAQVTAASIHNQALLTYLRYPSTLWWIGIAQCISRIRWLLRHQRRQGILQGLFNIPKAIRQHHQYRQTVSANGLRSHLSLRRQPITVNLSKPT